MFRKKMVAGAAVVTSLACPAAALAHRIELRTVLVLNGELSTRLRPDHAVAALNGGCDRPRVDGRRGRWTEHHAVVVWPAKRVTFERGTFTNSGTRTVSVRARC